MVVEENENREHKIACENEKGPESLQIVNTAVRANPTTKAKAFIVGFLFFVFRFLFFIFH